MANTKGLVIEMIRSDADGTPQKWQQAVIFDGILMERLTTPENKRKHWRSATYPAGRADYLAATDDSSWLGKWLRDKERRGYVLLGAPFLMDANDQELAEIREGKMPRAMVLRLNKSRTELGVAAPWTEKED